MIGGEPETLEVQYAQGLRDRARAGPRVEMVAGQFRDEPFAREGVQGPQPRLLSGGRAPALAFALDDQQLGRRKGRQHRQEVCCPGVGRDAKLTR